MSHFRPAAIVAAVLALPLAAAWAFLRPPPGNTRVEPETEPDVFESELEAYNWGAISAGDWVEHEVATSSRLDESWRVRTRLACVGIEGGTAWVEARDHLVARFFPGSVLLLEVERASGRIDRAWWGPPGSRGEPVEVRRLPGVPGSSGIVRRGRGEAAMMSVAGFAFPCTRLTLQERSAGGEWSSHSSVWLAPGIPFPRRACMGAGNDQVAWEGSPGAGGVAWEEYSGLTVRMTSQVVAWGRDAKWSLAPR
ncbi:MAG: hypothetical protein K8T20_20895 [Planctomycetes bacterium]|nr:hypothetical protein [Planctomycetota bacterium]